MATRDSPDIYARALGPAALGLGHIYQANSSWPWYNYYITLNNPVYKKCICSKNMKLPHPRNYLTSVAYYEETV